MGRNSLSAHLYKDGHVTHNWQQSQFLAQAFTKEDQLRAEVERYGGVKARRSSMLDWKDSNSARSHCSLRSSRSTRSLNPAALSRKKSARTYRSNSSRSSCSCSTYSSRSTYSCSSSVFSGCSSYCSCDCHDCFSTNSSISARSDSTALVEKLRERKQRLEQQLEELEVEMNGYSSR